MNIINILIGYKGDDMKTILKIIFMFLIIIAIIMLFPNLDNSFVKTGKLYISEIMASNTYTIPDSNKEYSDYIEIYNGYKTKMNLYGYYLSDEEFDIRKWSFPDIDINPGEYLIIYASGKDKCDIEERICHTNFKLSSEGEVLTLTDNSGNIISKFTYGSMNNDVAYGYKNGKYVYLNEATPGKENSGKLKYTKISKGSILVNEYMVHNQRNNYDNSGFYSDWIELYNSSDKDLKLENIYLTDDEDNLKKYKLPNLVIKKQNYLVVYLSGESKVIDNYIYANFKLGVNDKKIIISNGKKKIDEVEIVELIENVSYGKVGKSWKYFTSPTPGYKNTTKGFDTLGGVNGNS